jgi:hypothetical protein
MEEVSLKGMPSIILGQGVDQYQDLCLRVLRVSFTRKSTTAKIGEHTVLAVTSQYVGDVSRYEEATSRLSSRNSLSPQ